LKETHLFILEFMEQGLQFLQDVVVLYKVFMCHVLTSNNAYPFFLTCFKAWYLLCVQSSNTCFQWLSLSLILQMHFDWQSKCCVKINNKIITSTHIWNIYIYIYKSFWRNRFYLLTYLILTSNRLQLSPMRIGSILDASWGTKHYY